MTAEYDKYDGYDKYEDILYLIRIGRADEANEKYKIYEQKYPHYMMFKIVETATRANNWNWMKKQFRQRPNVPRFYLDLYLRMICYSRNMEMLLWYLENGMERYKKGNDIHYGSIISAIIENEWIDGLNALIPYLDESGESGESDGSEKSEESKNVVIKIPDWTKYHKLSTSFGKYLKFWVHFVFRRKYSIKKDAIISSAASILNKYYLHTEPEITDETYRIDEHYFEKNKKLVNDMNYRIDNYISNYPVVNRYSFTKFPFIMYRIFDDLQKMQFDIMRKGRVLLSICKYFIDNDLIDAYKILALEIFKKKERLLLDYAAWNKPCIYNEVMPFLYVYKDADIEFIKELQKYFDDDFLKDYAIFTLNKQCYAYLSNNDKLLEKYGCCLHNVLSHIGANAWNKMPDVRIIWNENIVCKNHFIDAIASKHEFYSKLYASFLYYSYDKYIKNDVFDIKEAISFSQRGMSGD